MLRLKQTKDKGMTRVCGISGLKIGRGCPRVLL